MNNPKKPVVLNVDDNESGRYATSRMLRLEGFEVWEAANGEEALRLAQQQPDIVLLDVNLPDMSGLEVCRRLKSNPATSDLPVLHLSATSIRAIDRAAGLDSGADGYLVQPVEAGELSASLRALLRLRERERQLRESEAHFRRIFEESPVCYLSLDAQGLIREVNPAWLRVTGYLREQVIGMPLTALLTPDCQQHYEKQFPLFLSQGSCHGCEMELHCKDGRVLMFVLDGLFVKDARGRPQYAHCVLHNVTEQRQAELQLRKLALALEQAPVSIMITDKHGVIEYVNPKFSQMTGYTFEEVKGQNPRLLKSGETPAEEYQQLWATITQGKEWRGEFRNKRKDGTIYSEAISIAPVRDARGNITHFIAFGEDVTERRQMEVKLLRVQRLESIGSLASGIAHDLNNILTPIVMCAPLLADTDSETERRELAATIENSAERAVGIVKQLLAFARGKEGRKEPLQVRHLIREMVKLARETFPRNITVVENCPNNLWLINADASQIHQVLLNLCINARDAMPGGGKLTLRAENVVLDEHFTSLYPEASPGPHVRLDVVDTGTGIPEEYQGRIFESFFTTKAEGQGTGLGLTTVQGIVKNHKGIITFTTALNKGTTFTVYLPAKVETPAEVTAIKEETSAIQAHGELILVVDDEAVICKTTRRTLESYGFKVIEAPNGIEGLALFTQHQADIKAVVTDYMMPLMDGATLARAIRALSPHTPIVVSTGGFLGKGGTTALATFKELGVHYVLTKPHSGAVLLRAVAEAVGLIPPSPPPPLSSEDVNLSSD